MNARALGFAVVLGVLPVGCAPHAVRLEPAFALSEAERVSEPSLRVGDPAPGLRVSEWLRGEPVARFEPGRVYVLEFWATWCGPCVAHLPSTSKVQKRFVDAVDVIAVTTLDRTNTAPEVRRVIEDHADRADFRFAVDDGDAMARSYQRASRYTSVPAAFVVDQTGRLAWLGHPMDAEPVIAAIVNGTWDRAAEAERSRRRGEERARSRTLIAEHAAARRAGDDSRRLAILDELCAMEPGSVPFCPPWHFETERIELLAHQGFAAKASRAAEAAVGRPQYRGDAQAIAAVSLAASGSDVDTAGRLADRAERLLEDHYAVAKPGADDEWKAYLRQAARPFHADAYARLAAVRARQGRSADAARLLETAIALNGRGSPRSWEAREVEKWKEQLKTYRDRAATGNGAPD